MPTHRGKFDLTTPAGMRKGAARKAAQRARERYVLGCLRLVDGEVKLYGLAQGLAWNIVRPHAITSEWRDQYRFGTRQAAQQYADRHGLAGLRVFKIEHLRVVTDSPRSHGEHREHGENNGNE